METGSQEQFVHMEYFGHTVNIDTVIVTWIIICVCTVLLILLRNRLKVIPGKIQAALEMIFEFFDEQAEGMIGPEGREYTPVVFFIFITVLLYNWIGVLPGELKMGKIPLFIPPTRDINTTLALAICTFIIFNYYGFKKKGMSYFKNFIHPAPEVAKSLPIYMIWLIVPLTALFLILNIVELMARILSLSIRLFGNILGEHIVGAALILFTTVVLKLFLVAGIFTYLLPLFVFFLSIITGAVQAFIFAILTLTYISGAIAEYE